jgi:Domain of unknown function (DUF4965)/Domain of unknown function (DUF5127)/Domain of unknown function (DUF1793)/Domain of unknown function (DUF4964)
MTIDQCLSKRTATTDRMHWGTGQAAAELLKREGALVSAWDMSNVALDADVVRACFFHKPGGIYFKEGSLVMNASKRWPLRTIVAMTLLSVQWYRAQSLTRFRSPLQLLALLSLATVLNAQQGAFRPPAAPLVTHDPYFSIWSMADRLTDDPPRHWTGTAQALTSLVRVDGKTYRVMGNEPKQIPALPQTHMEVLPTRTIYDFEGFGVRIKLTFLTPALTYDLDVVSRPASYITWEAESEDGRDHAIEVYFDASSDVVVNTPDEPVVWGRVKVGNLEVLRIGSQQQPVLEKHGDDLRIDWGYLYVTAPGPGIFESATDGPSARVLFQESGRLPDTDDLMDDLILHRARRRTPVLALKLDLGNVGQKPVSKYLVLAYDDIFSVEYLNQHMQPYWRRNGEDAGELLRAAVQDYQSLSERSAALDRKLMADLTRVGGEKFAVLGALSYRQTVAGNKLVATIDGTPWLFPKENFSNGCISTVDVLFPNSPFWLLFNPHLLEAQMTPVLQYAASGRWRFPFAPHDLGVYPHANGQVYGGGEVTQEDQMPVEESGDMLIMAAALAKIEGNGNFANRYWPLLTRWAEYLKAQGLDPENQLATNDMSGHLAHNTDLSIKAILGIGAYGKLCEMTGRTEEAGSYLKTAREYADKWASMADDGDHYRMAFGSPGTWSQKHNLIWDRVLGLNIFPASIAEKETAFYLTKLNRYGLPVDSRMSYSLVDFTVWTAALADSKETFETLVQPIYRYADETPDRVPFADTYGTVDGTHQYGRARPVVGGIFLPMLLEPGTWEKWAHGGVERAGSDN